MEDAHIALTDMKCEGLSSAPKFSLFAVFDGHGGGPNNSSVDFYDD